jgi:hypothetical protein
MAPIYKKITLEWNGKTYNVTPTYEMIEEIEQRLSLAKLMTRLSHAEPPFSQLSRLLAYALRFAGCEDEDATPEAINAEMYEAENCRRLLEAATRIVYALVPQKVPRGKEGAPPQGAEQETTSTSTGESTTESSLVASRLLPQNSGK